MGASSEGQPAQTDVHAKPERGQSHANYLCGWFLLHLSNSFSFGICHVKYPWNSFLDTLALHIPPQHPSTTNCLAPTPPEKQRKIPRSSRAFHKYTNTMANTTIIHLDGPVYQNQCSKSFHWVFAMSSTPGIISWTHLPSTTSFHHQLPSPNHSRKTPPNSTK